LYHIDDFSNSPTISFKGEGSTRWGDLSSDGEDVKDDNYEVDLSEDDSISFDTTTRPHKTKPHKTKDRGNYQY